MNSTWPKSEQEQAPNQVRGKPVPRLFAILIIANIFRAVAKDSSSQAPAQPNTYAQQTAERVQILFEVEVDVEVEVACAVSWSLL